MGELNTVEIRALLRQIESQLEPTPAQPAPPTNEDAVYLAMVDRAKRILNNRRVRAKFFDADLFGEPAFDILLDVFVSEADGKELCVGDICAGAGVPTTTAARQIRDLCSRGLLIRSDDPFDGRRVFVRLNDATRRSMLKYLNQMKT